MQSVILDLGNADPKRAQLVLEAAAERRVPVVLLTPLTGGRARDKVKLPDHGLHIRVTKPLKRRELLRVLADLDHHVKSQAAAPVLPAPRVEPATAPQVFGLAEVPALFAPAPAPQPVTDPIPSPPLVPVVPQAPAWGAIPDPQPMVQMPAYPPAQAAYAESVAGAALQGMLAGMPMQQAAAMLPYLQAAMAAGYGQNVPGAMPGYYPQQFPMFQPPVPGAHGLGNSGLPAMPPAAPPSPPAMMAAPVVANPPVAVAPPAPAPAKAFSAKSSSNTSDQFAIQYPARILLVDDQPLNHKIVTLFLQRLGYKNVDIANNGQEGVEMVNRGGYDIVFMDLQMPVMGGVEAAKEIRGNFLLKQQPAIIAMTGHALSGVKESCMEAGMNDFLTKPVSLDDFRRVIPQCLEAAMAG